MHRARLCKRGLKSRISGGPLPKQLLEVMRKRVQQFHHGLVVVAAGGSEQEAQDEAGQTDHTFECVAKGLQCLSATHSIVGRADTIDFRVWPVYSQRMAPEPPQWLPSLPA